MIGGLDGLLGGRLQRLSVREGRYDFGRLFVPGGL
jgi:hypothetical protein